VVVLWRKDGLHTQNLVWMLSLMMTHRCQEVGGHQSRSKNGLRVWGKVTGLYGLDLKCPQTNAKRLFALLGGGATFRRWGLVEGSEVTGGACP
jgi:hypothetical protein